MTKEEIEKEYDQYQINSEYTIGKDEFAVFLEDI